MKVLEENYIKNLKHGEVFVFGSNEAGIHGAGAAKQALKWGAVKGIGFGMRGQTFAIPTKNKHLQTLALKRIERYVNKFKSKARMLYKHGFKYKFLVTEIGCGLAGYKPEDIAPFFKGCTPNVYLPKSFYEILKNQ